MNFNEYNKIIKECEDIAKKKNKDYGDECILEFGEMGLLIRINDKINRLKNIYRKNRVEVGDEVIEDTIKDTINYLIYFLMINQNKFTNGKETSKSN